MGSELTKAQTWTADEIVITEVRLHDLATQAGWSDAIYPSEGVLMAIELLRLRKQLKAVADALDLGRASLAKEGKSDD